MSKVSYQERTFRQKLLAGLSLRFRHHVEICVDLRSVGANPLEGAYLSPDAPFVVDVPPAQCRGFHAAAFPLRPDSPHPFVATVHAILGGLTDHASSPLATYYARFRPASAAEVLGLPLTEAHNEFAGTPLCATLPWESRSPAEARSYWESACIRDYRQNGFRLGLGDGWKAWGPLSDSAIEAEFTRLLRIVRSVRQNGYMRHAASDGDIHGRILKRGAQTRLLLSAGQHRAAVLAALGYPAIPVRLVASVVDIDESHHWPNVRRGYFTPEQARRIFNRVFDGKQPATLARAFQNARRMQARSRSSTVGPKIAALPVTDPAQGLPVAAATTAPLPSPPCLG